MFNLVWLWTKLNVWVHVCLCVCVCVSWSIENCPAGEDRPVPEEIPETPTQITQNPSETEPSGDREELGEEMEEVENKQQVDITQEKEEKSHVLLQKKPEAVPYQAESKLEEQHSQGAVQQQEEEQEEEIEQVETFFSTMSHRYGNTPQEGHIL